MSAFEELASAFAEEHPEEVARLAEMASVENFAAFLETLTPSVAAAVVARAAPLPAATALRHVDAARSSRILEELDPGAVAGILRRLEPDQRKEVIKDLRPRLRERVLSLAAYGPEQAGGRLDPRATAVAVDVPVRDVLDYVRAEPIGSLYYVYVIDDTQRLVGVANMRELMLADPGAPIRSIMVAEPDHLLSDDSLQSIVRHPAWRRVHALPVVDRQGRFLGAIRYSTFRAIDAELGRSLSGPDPHRTASALAELYSIGFGAAARFAVGAVSGGLRSGGAR